MKTDNSIEQKNDDTPEWLIKMIKRGQTLNQQYETAHGEFAQVYNEFLMMIEEINDKYGTEFSFEQAFREYQGMMADDAPDAPEDEDDDEEDFDA